MFSRPPTSRAAAVSVTRAVILSLIAIISLAACGTGNDAVESGGTFDFVSPGGKTVITYDPPESRGTLGKLRGPELMVDGQQIGVDDFPNQVVVINIWGQWCGPCRGEAADLEQVYSSTKDLGVAFLGINVRDSQQDKARDFVTDNKITYPSIYDPAMRTLTALGGKFPSTVIPSTLVLDRQHRVAAVYLRSLLADDLNPIVRKLAAESNA